MYIETIIINIQASLLREIDCTTGEYKAGGQLGEDREGSQLLEHPK